MTFKYFLVAVLIGFIFYLLLLPRLDAVCARAPSSWSC